MKGLLTRKIKQQAKCDYLHTGYYFVTMCTKGRHKLFGTILAGLHARPLNAETDSRSRPIVKLTKLGVIVQETINHV